MHRTQNRNFGRISLAIAIASLLLCTEVLPALATARYLDRSAQVQTTTPAPPVLRDGDAAEAVAGGSQNYSLPFDWSGEPAIPIEDIAKVAPPLAALQVMGAFEATYVPDEDHDLIRVLSTSTDQQRLLLGWRLASDATNPAIPIDSVVRLSVTARLHSPPAGAALSIFTNVGGNRGSSSVRMNDVTWQEYSVARYVEADTRALVMAIDWVPTVDNAWIELRNLRVEFEPADTGIDEALSPTDTPSPVPTVTPVPPSPTPTPTATITPTLFVVTSTPTPEDVFAAATHVAMNTEWARIVGSATPTPPNMVTATFTPTPTPTITPLIVTNTPVPGNAATATYDALFAAAVALSTGTPTPIPADAVIYTATPTKTPKTPKPKAPKPTRTPTPFFVLLTDVKPTAEPTPTLPVPDEMLGKIVFLSDYLSGRRSRPNAYVINPDGSDVAVLTQLHFHTRAKERDAWSADNRYFVYARREHAFGKAGNFQIFYDDTFYSSFQHQLTYFGVGTAWAPVWSPTSDTIALVSSESANDEIWIAQRGEWPAQQITKNDWEWDHHPSFSPDGTQLTFMSNRVTGTRQVWVMDVNGENARQLTFLPGAEAWDPVWLKYKD